MPRLPPRPRLVIALGLAALASACATQEFDGRVFRNGEMAFQVGPIPPGWRRIEADHTLLAFRDDQRGATIALNGRCGKDGDDVPLESLTHHLFLQFRAREILSQERQKLDGREALRTEMVAELDGVPKRFTVLVLKKDGCVYDFLRIGASESGGDDFDRFVQGFATLS